jgi:alanine dehydrogenase
MKIGVPTEIKILEKRVSVTPSGVLTLVHDGHTVYVQSGAGLGSGFSDEMYRTAGAEVIQVASDVWQAADMIIKVKEPLDPEFSYMKKGQLLFTYLHLAADEDLTQKCLRAGVNGVAYETIQLADDSLPLLAPMSEVAGRLSIQMGCAALEAKNGGKGLLLSGVPGVKPADVVIIGGGISGVNAAHLAVGMGARVTIMDINLERLRYLEDIFHSRAVTIMSNRNAIEDAVVQADLVIGSVLIPGAKAPKLVTKEMIQTMEKGSALVDIAIDQGGCFETSKPTTHDEPMYIVSGIVHYCVANMPGAVPHTSTYALTNATLPYARELAGKGLLKAMDDNLSLAKGLNVYKGTLTCKGVADSLGMVVRPLSKIA